MPAMSIEYPADLNTRFEVLRPKISQAETEDSWEVNSKNLKALSEWGTLRVPNRIDHNHTVNFATNNEQFDYEEDLAIFSCNRLAATGLGKLLGFFAYSPVAMWSHEQSYHHSRQGIIETTQLYAIISYFVQSIEDKSTSIRLAAAEGTLTNPPNLEKDVRAREVETIIRAAAKDPQVDIRVIGRKLFEAYKVLLPKRVES